MVSRAPEGPVDHSPSAAGGMRAGASGSRVVAWQPVGKGVAVGPVVAVMTVVGVGWAAVGVGAGVDELVGASVALLHAASRVASKINAGRNFLINEIVILSKVALNVRQMKNPLLFQNAAFQWGLRPAGSHQSRSGGGQAFKDGLAHG